MRRIAALGSLLAFGFWAITEAAAAPCTLPYPLTNGQVADATQVMADLQALADCIAAAPAGSTNALQTNAGSGAFGSVGPLTDGQVVIGSTGNAPQASTLTAGSGIAITNGPGNVSISATGAAELREFGPFLPPSASMFTYIDSALSITPTISDVADVGLVYSTTIANSTNAVPGAYVAVPSSVPWTLTIRISQTTSLGNYPSFGIFIKDTAGKMLGLVRESASGTYNLIVKRLSSNTTFVSNIYATPIVSVPQWLRVSYDGVNIQFSTSWDSQNWVINYSETSTAFLNGNLQYVGIGGNSGMTTTTLWRAGSKSGAVVTYWNLSS